MGKRVVDGYSYFSTLWALLLRSITGIRAGIILIILLDFIFYAGAFGMVSVAATKIKAGYDSLTFPDPTLQTISPEDAASMLEQMKSFRNTTFAILAVVAIGIILWWSVCKGIIWSLALKESIKIRTLWRAFMLNLAWLGCWMLLVSVLAYVINFAMAKYFLLGLIFLFVILTSTIYAVFIPKPDWSSFKQGVFLAITRFHLITLPSILLLLGYILFSKVFTLSPHIAMQIALMVFTLAYAAFARQVMVQVIWELRTPEHKK